MLDLQRKWVSYGIEGGHDLSKKRLYEIFAKELGKESKEVVARARVRAWM